MGGGSIQDYMHPLKLSHKMAMDRAWEHQGVPPADRQYVSLSTGGGNRALWYPGRATGLEGYRLATETTGRLGCWSCFHLRLHPFPTLHFHQNNTL